MWNRLVHALLPLLCVCCACALGAQAAQGRQWAISKEQIVLEAIRGANKSLYVAAPGPISEPIFAELAIRHKSRTKENKIVTLEITAGDAGLGARFVRMGAKAWASPKFADVPEVLIIDRSVVIKDFNSQRAMEVIKNPALAKRLIKGIKKGRKSSEKIKADANKSKWWWALKILIGQHPGSDPWLN